MDTIASNLVWEQVHPTEPISDDEATPESVEPMDTESAVMPMETDPSDDTDIPEEDVKEPVDFSYPY